MAFWRVGLVVSALGAAGASSASFDLMLLPGSDDRIYRYDPVNNVHLGSYGSGSTNAMIAANTQGHSYGMTNSSSATRAYQYSSGEFGGVLSTNTTTRATELHSSGFYTLTTSTLRRFNVNTGANTGSSPLGAGVNWRTMALSGNFLVLAGVNSSNQISFQNFNLNTFSSTAVVSTTVTVVAGSVFGKAAVGVNAITGASWMGFTFEDAGGLRLGSVGLDGTGQVTTTAVSNSGLGSSGGYDNSSVMPAVVSGHSGLFVYGQDFTTPTTLARISRYDVTGTGLLFNSSSTFGAPGGAWDVAPFGFHPANVVAPEPGSMLALGAGVAAMLKRRRPHFNLREERTGT